ncbi:MAG: quinone-dependent dihydroorotate dehydrogenase [Pseudomonadota bacterium]
MTRLWDKFGQWLFFRFDAEQAHALALSGLKTGQLKPRRTIEDPRLHVAAAGLNFPNPVGVAAGFDKNAEVYQPLLKLGYGFTEVGTITPLAQKGNPKPRVFRLTADSAVINRLGFNNKGHRAARDMMRLTPPHGIVGVNIGANKDSNDRIGDYVKAIEEFHDLAAYFAVNVSSPNTPGLRDLQTREKLSELLARVGTARLKAFEESGHRVPIFLKIAPDITEADLDDICAEVLDKGIDGMIVSNTTFSRSDLTFDNGEAGGMSGKPVFDRSTIMLAKTRQRVGKDLALIGVGGVDDAHSALDKIRAGADVVQLYTGMIYKGPHVAQDICAGILEALDADGAASITAFRDRDVSAWAAKAIPA